MKQTTFRDQDNFGCIGVLVIALLIGCNVYGQIDTVKVKILFTHNGRGRGPVMSMDVKKHLGQYYYLSGKKIEMEYLYVWQELLTDTVKPDSTTLSFSKGWNRAGDRPYQPYEVDTTRVTGKISFNNSDTLITSSGIPIYRREPVYSDTTPAVGTIIFNSDYPKEFRYDTTASKWVEWQRMPTVYPDTLAIRQRAVDEYKKREAKMSLLLFLISAVCGLTVFVAGWRSRKPKKDVT